MTQSQSKQYCVEAHGGGDCDNTPSVANFYIDEATAKLIGQLAEYVKANDLYTVVKWDARAWFLQFDPETEPEDAAEAGAENDVRTECDRLMVSADEFWFAAYIKHTDAEVSSERQPIGALLAHFGILWREGARSAGQVIYLTNALGELTGHGTLCPTDEDLAKVPFEAGPGYVLPYLVEIDHRRFVLGNLEVAYQDDPWGEDLWSRLQPEPVVRDYCEALCDEIATRLQPGMHLLPIDEKMEGRFVVGVAIDLDDCPSRQATFDALAAVFGRFTELPDLDDELDVPPGTSGPATAVV